MTQFGLTMGSVLEYLKKELLWAAFLSFLYYLFGSKSDCNPLCTDEKYKTFDRHHFDTTFETFHTYSKCCQVEKKTISSTLPNMHKIHHIHNMFILWMLFVGLAASAIGNT